MNTYFAYHMYKFNFYVITLSSFHTEIIDSSIKNKIIKFRSVDSKL